MAAIWGHNGQDWRPLHPAGFPDEASLHDLIEASPQLLPLAGGPTLVVVGREVRLGGGYADLIAVEPSGRPVIIEIKLARNSEARRAVIAQVLTYAAHLRGLSSEEFEQDTLRNHLQQRGYESLAGAIRDNDQEGSFDESSFRARLADSLASGSFRLVVVLDAAPSELVRLAGYLESVADKVLIDLITVAAYEVDGAKILVPQRVDPEHNVSPAARPTSSANSGRLVEGSDDFESSIDDSDPTRAPDLRRLLAWARRLEAEGLARLSTYHGTTGRKTLLPRLQPENVGLVTVWNEKGAVLQFWRSVFEKKAPKALAAIEAQAPSIEVRQGNSVREFDDDLLELIHQGYIEANS